MLDFFKWPSKKESLPAASTTSKGVFSRLKEGLSRTRETFLMGFNRLFLAGKLIDSTLLEELETFLLSADVGVKSTETIMQNLKERLKHQELQNPEALALALKENLNDLLIHAEIPLRLPEATKPFVILMVGVNGAGKTTTIGKLAKKFQEEGKTVMLAAGDTFRAAAIEQLKIWGERNRIPVIAQHMGADSASVIFDAFQAAKAKNVDILIADTAGRLHTQDTLMEELKKIVRVMRKLDEHAPHEILLVLDAGTGQNALMQAKKFHEALNITGIALTKLDGTAKGGVIFNIAKTLRVPIRFVGIGEGLEDLREFTVAPFIDALFSND